MRTLRGWVMRLRGLFSKQRREAEMSQEIESHPEMHAADNMRAGMTAEQAIREALLSLGGIEATREAYRAQSTVPFLENLLLDLHFGVRQFRKSPAFAATAVLVLALGISASVSIFAFVDAALIKPVPYPDPQSLMMVTETSRGFRQANLSWLDYQDWKRFNTSLRSLDVHSGTGFLFNAVAGTEPVPGAAVSGGFFQTLGVAPLLGRLFSPEEEMPGQTRTLVLSYRIWQQRFGGSSAVLGQAVRLSGETYTVIGVLPADFQFARRGAAELWTLIDISNQCTKRRSCHNLDGVARLKPGVSIASALADLSAIAKRLEQQYPDSNRDRGASLIPLAEVVTGNFRPILIVLMGGSGLLLLIACANVCGLVLARSEARQREIAMRSALGASRARLWSQFVTEGLPVVLCASALGLMSARAAMQVLKGLVPVKMMPGMPFLRDLGLNGHVLAYTMAVAVLAVALFSLAPVLHVAVSKTPDTLNEASRGSSGKAWRRLGSRLVVTELAIAMILLTGAGLLGKSLYRLLHVDLRFRTDHLAMIDVAAPDVHPGTEEQSIRLVREIVRKVESLPGVCCVAATSATPRTDQGRRW